MGGTVNFAQPFTTKNDDCNFNITIFPFLASNIFCPPMAYLSCGLYDMTGLVLLMIVLFCLLDKLPG